MQKVDMKSKIQSTADGTSTLHRLRSFFVPELFINTMGCGKSWDSCENESLALAWIAAFEDPIVGTDHNAKRFMKTVRRRFIEKGLEASEVVEGVGIVGILSMAVAIHTYQTTTIECEYKDYSTENWIYFKEYEVLKNLPKWSSPLSTVPTVKMPPESEEETQLHPSEASSTENITSKGPVRGTKREKERFYEERNAIEVFSRPEAAGLQETADFFATICVKYLLSAQKKLELQHMRKLLYAAGVNKGDLVRARAHPQRSLPSIPLAIDIASDENVPNEVSE
eukprot:IDg11562t1